MRVQIKLKRRQVTITTISGASKTEEPYNSQINYEIVLTLRNFIMLEEGDEEEKKVGVFEGKNGCCLIPLICSKLKKSFLAFIRIDECIYWS